MKHQDIYEYIGSEEALFKMPIAVTTNWDWSMSEHINLTVLYKNSVFSTGQSPTKPFKNITRPILSLQYRAEGFDVKDIVLFINDKYKYFKSFLVRKFHDKWARENKLDTFIDKLVEAYVDFGGVLVKKTKEPIPEVVPWQRIAFCDQTSILSGPIAERHSYSPEELEGKSKFGWYNLDKAILFADNQKQVSGPRNADKPVATPGKYIEVFEIHGLFPRYWLYDYDDKGNYTGDFYRDDAPEMELIRQVHICCFYQDENQQKRGLTLFKGTEKESPYKLLLRDEIYNRGLGLGGAEELFEPQVWTNYGMIRVKELLDAASKVIFKTTDPAFANRNKTTSLQQGEILVLEDGKDIAQIDTAPCTTQLFDNFVLEWEAQARSMGAASESITGDQPPAATPFQLL